MDISQIRSKVKELCKDKNATLKQYEEVYYLLDSIKNEEAEKGFYLNAMGRVLLKQGNYEEAKHYFKEQLKHNPEFKSCFYQLYKIDVHEKDYISAYQDLCTYEQDLSSKNKIDITLPLALIELCLDLNYKPGLYDTKDYRIAKSDCYMFHRFNSKLVVLYNEVIDCFNTKKFSLMKRKLIELNRLTVIKDVPIDLKPVIEMTEFILEAVLKQERQKSISSLKQIDKNSNKDVIIKTCVCNKVLTLKESFKNVKELIESGKITEADNLLNEIKENYIIDEEIAIYDYLKLYIKEEKQLERLSEEDKMIYDEVLKIAKLQSQLNKKDEALDWYQYGMEKTHLSIFDYYCGKMYFKLKDYKSASYYLNKYKNTASKKRFQALLYLAVINKRIGKIGKANMRINELKKLTTYFDIEWNIDFVKRNKQEDFDAKKSVASRKIVMGESSFKEKELDFNFYDSYDLVDKLTLIKRLYQNGRIEYADELMRELEKVSTKEQKKLIQNERKRKVLYINQAKCK